MTGTPVFVDASGRRARVVTAGCWLLATGFGGYVLLVVVALFLPQGALSLAIPGLGPVLPKTGAGPLTGGAGGTGPPAAVLPPSPTPAGSPASRPTERVTSTPTSRPTAVSTQTPARTPVSTPTARPTAPPSATAAPTQVRGSGRASARPSSKPRPSKTPPPHP